MLLDTIDTGILSVADLKQEKGMTKTEIIND